MSDEEQKGPPPVRRGSARQREAGAATRRETRRLLLVAAGELFAERGYAASTVTAIAERAGVSLQTLYLAWGSKRDLLRAFAETALSGREEGVTPAYVPGLQTAIETHGAGSRDLRARLRGLAGQLRLMAEGGGDRGSAALAWKLYRDAAGADPEIAADWAGLQQLRRTTFDALLSTVPEQALRPGMTHEDAAQTAWVIASPETYDLLVRHGGSTPSQFEQWVGRTLITALLPDEQPAAR